MSEFRPIVPTQMQRRRYGDQGIYSDQRDQRKKRKYGGANDGQVCFRCGEPGHIARECPSRIQNNAPVVDVNSHLDAAEKLRSQREMDRDSQNAGYSGKALWKIRLIQQQEQEKRDAEKNSLAYRLREEKDLNPFRVGRDGNVKMNAGWEPHPEMQEMYYHEAMFEKEFETLLFVFCFGFFQFCDQLG